ncbi:hypothetical protein EMCRGX_G006184 [Ephydatia muelleri]
MNRSRSLPSDPEFLFQFMEDIDSDDDFDGYVDDVTETLPGEVNDGGAAKEMLHMIMSGCNIAAEVDAIDEEVDAIDKDGDVMEGEGEEGVGAEVVREEGMCAMKISGNAVPNGAGDVIPVPSDRASRGSIPKFIQCSGVMKNMEGMEPLDFFYELFPEDLIEYIVLESNRCGQQYIDSHASYLKDHPRARAHQFMRNMFTPHDIRKVLGLIICMGIVNMPSVENYWNTRWPFNTNNFRAIMSRDRFLLVMKFLHLADNSRMVPREQPGHSKIYKVEHVVNTLVNNYKSNYTLNKEISVDESCQPGSVRLVGGSSSQEGRIEFCAQSSSGVTVWGSVCNALSYGIAEVVCRQLNYSRSGAVVYNVMSFGPSQNPFVLDGVYCNGGESSLLSCTNSGYHRCHKGQESGVKCQNLCTSGDVHLVDGYTPTEGRLEMCINGSWTTFYGYYSYWDTNAANVACRQMFGKTAFGTSQYYSGSYPYFYGSQYGEGTGSLVISQISCIGNETRLSSCNYTISTGYGHSYDAGIRCYVNTSCAEGQVRLVDGSTANEGQIEFCRGGVWVAIYGSGWNYNDAVVVCRQLGYHYECRSAEKGSNANPCTNRPIPCPTCSVSDVPNAYVWSYHWLDHMQIAHSSQHVSAEQVNKFAISKDEYVGVLGKELTAKKLKEEFLLLKTDILMEPRISLFWSKLMREEWE